MSDALHSLRIDLSKGQFLDKLLAFIRFVVEYAFGIHAGYAIGWVTGFFAGRFYAGRYEPVYLADLSKLSSLLSYWRSVPYTFARNGALIGLAVGIIVIALIQMRSHKECKSDEHTKHLCHFVSYGHHVHNEKDYKELIKEPKYKCNFCGLTANLAESLCKPLEL